jgi:hypothetical protein
MKALQESEQKKPWTNIYGSLLGAKTLRRLQPSQGYLRFNKAVNTASNSGNSSLSLKSVKRR